MVQQVKDLRSKLYRHLLPDSGGLKEAGIEDIRPRSHEAISCDVAEGRAEHLRGSRSGQYVPNVVK